MSQLTSNSFVKFLNADRRSCHNFLYKEGLNVDTLEFNPSGYCQSGGLYFTTVENSHLYFEYGNLIAVIQLENDSKVYREPCGTKFKANKFSIVKFLSFDEFLNYIPDNILQNFCLHLTIVPGIRKRINSPSERVSLQIIEQDWTCFYHLKNPTESVLQKAEFYAKREGKTIVTRAINDTESNQHFTEKSEKKPKSHKKQN